MNYKQEGGPFITTHHKTTTQKMRDGVSKVTKVTRRQYKTEDLM